MQGEHVLQYKIIPFRHWPVIRLMLDVEPHSIAAEFMPPLRPAEGAREQLNAKRFHCWALLHTAADLSGSRYAMGLPMRSA